ncbi:amidohydrolase family protein [Methylobacterium sp. E-065]|nr:amidohydrolase family protein [Methylobacterium sp. E-065]
MTDDTCLAPDPDVRPPTFRMPPGATDTHFHIFGPNRLERLVPQRDYTPPEAAAASARRLFDALGIERIVVVQASVFGLDNRDQLEEGAAIGLPMRAVVVVGPDASEAEMRALHERGARGIRFIMAHPGGLEPSGIERAAARASEMGWHLQFLLKPAHLVKLEPRLRQLSCPVVIDHMGFLAPEQGLEQPGFQALRRLIEAGTGWVKLSGAYRLSQGGPHYPELRPYVEALLALRPDRLLWGSDWPHVGLRSGMPNTSDLLELFGSWVSDEADRRRILVDNPDALFGF